MVSLVLMSKEFWEYENEISHMKWLIERAESVILSKMHEIKVASQQLAIAQLKLKELEVSE